MDTLQHVHLHLAVHGGAKTLHHPVVADHEPKSLDLASNVVTLHTTCSQQHEDQ
jgi:hypothetical protein